MRTPCLSHVLSFLVVLLMVGTTDAQVDELAKLVSPTADSGEQAGESVSLSGDFAAVGLPHNDLLGREAGSVDLYQFDGTGWVHATTLTASDGAAGDLFGISLELRGDRLVVGATRASSPRGAAYVFHYDGTDWQEEAILAADVATDTVFFGRSVSLDGDTIAVSALGDLIGSVYIFRFNGATWLEEQVLDAPARFDGEISVRGGVLAAGSDVYDSVAVNAGAVFLFRFDGTSWIEEQLIAPLELDDVDRFGRSLALDDSGETLVVGAWFDDDYSTNSGAAYVFRYDGSTWVLEQKLTDPLTRSDDRLGSSVAIDGDLIALGALYHDAFDRFGLEKLNLGATFLFQFDGAAWTMDQRILPGDGDSSDFFGSDVAVDLGRVLVGATHAASPAGTTGAAYIFAIIDCNSNGIADLADIAGSTSFDCDLNGIPDECDFAEGASPDPQPPVWTSLPPSVVVGNESGFCGASVSWAPPTALDDCSPVTILESHEAGTFFPLGITVVTLSAADGAGNLISAQFTVTVEDHEAPMIDGLPADILIPAATGTCGAPVDFIPPTALDPCTGASITISHLPGDLFPTGTTVVTATASDGAGNVTVESFTVTVVDEVPPSFITRPPSVVRGCDPGEAFATVSWLPPITVDDCGSTQLDGPPATGQFPIGMTVLEYGATDLAGNRTTIQFSVTVIDVEPPVLILPAAVTLSIDEGACQALLTEIDSTAIDNSGSVVVTSSPTLPTLLSAGVHSILVIATDPAGNQTTQSLAVLVIDATPPTLTVPVDRVVAADLGSLPSQRVLMRSCTSSGASRAR